MKRYSALIIIGLVLMLAAGTLLAQSNGRTHGVTRPGTDAPQPTELKASLSKVYSAQEMEAGVYVGSEYCIACHTWSKILRDTKHSQALRRPMGMYTLMPGKGVVADYDKNGMDDFMQGLDFNQISTVFDKYKPNAPILSYDAAMDKYYVQIGTMIMPVISTQGGTGDWKQRYLLRVPVTDTADGYTVDNYVSPIQFNEVPDSYVAYHADDWYDDNNMPKFAPGMSSAMIAMDNTRQYNKKCIGCHTTGTRELSQLDSGEWAYRPYPATLYAADDPTYFDWDHDGIFDIVNVGCEACHGPGSAHIMGGGDPEKIVAPSHLEPAEQNALCGQCHGRYKSLPNKTHDWPIKDDTHTPWFPGQGLNLDEYATDAAGYYADGVTSRQHHQQFLDFQKSPKPGFAFHPVVCAECHSPHSARGTHQIRTRIVDGDLTIPTRDENDSLCLACHATHGPFENVTKEMVAEYDTNIVEISRVVSDHTKHPFAPDRAMGLSRCSLCHMPKTAKSAVPEDVASHTFETIAPTKTLMYQEQGGMPNSCQLSCHGTKVNLFGLGIDPTVTKFNEPFDVENATLLEMYFGPGGIWWDTDSHDSLTRKLISISAEPGTVPTPSASDLED